ncbi:MAG: hypothetical protein KJ011_16395 [Burkholderiaceae bacterium]|nr:hypothetical protein [Burkholderiaceae bacterium]
MFTNNPFASTASSLSDGFLQWFLVVMVLLVVLGTIFDVVHKGSARYFFESLRQSRRKGTREVGAAELASIAVRTAVVDVLASGEFCNARRRAAHLLGMYGFVLYVVATAVLVFGYPGAMRAGIWPALWWIGALMVCAGGYWFWFFIRADVAAEGRSPLRVVQADLFVLSLLASTTLGLAWAVTGGGTGALFWFYLAATAFLFGSVPWSKFAHMFFKPAAAFEKRISRANGTRNNLPAPADKPAKLGRQPKHARHY